MSVVNGEAAPVRLSATTSTGKTAALPDGYYLVRNLSSSADSVHVKAGPQASVTATTGALHLGAGQAVTISLRDPIDTIAAICPSSTATVEILRLLAP